MTSRAPNFFDTNLTWTAAKAAVMGGPGLPQLEVSFPPEYRHPENQWTPEHYFVSAIESGLMRTFLAMADVARLGIKSYRSETRGKLEWVEGAGFRITHIGISPEIEVYSEADEEKVLQLMEKAEKHCLALRSVNAPVLVTPTVYAPAQTAA
jgi:organic hydroperoxide reductase OsmC/OhrA